jgi:hypothetical protein
MTSNCLFVLADGFFGRVDLDFENGHFDIRRLHYFPDASFAVPFYHVNRGLIHQTETANRFIICTQRNDTAVDIWEFDSKSAEFRKVVFLGWKDNYARIDSMHYYKKVVYVAFRKLLQGQVYAIFTFNVGNGERGRIKMEELDEHVSFKLKVRVFTLQI